MMSQLLMNTESMVMMTVVGSLVISAAVLAVRSLVERKPVRQVVEVRRDKR